MPYENPYAGMQKGRSVTAPQMSQNVFAQQAGYKKQASEAKTFKVANMQQPKQSTAPQPTMKLKQLEAKMIEYADMEKKYPGYTKLKHPELALNQEEFSTMIKQKYPEYSDKDNLTLTKAMIKKYPQYKDRVIIDYSAKEEKDTKDKEGVLDYIPLGNLLGGALDTVASIPLNLSKSLDQGMGYIERGLGLRDLSGQGFGDTIENVSAPAQSYLGAGGDEYKAGKLGTSLSLAFAQPQTIGAMGGATALGKVAAGVGEGLLQSATYSTALEGRLPTGQELAFGGAIGGAIPAFAESLPALGAVSSKISKGIDDILAKVPKGPKAPNLRQRVGEYFLDPQLKTATKYIDPKANEEYLTAAKKLKENIADPEKGAMYKLVNNMEAKYDEFIAKPKDMVGKTIGDFREIIKKGGGENVFMQFDDTLSELDNMLANTYDVKVGSDGIISSIKGKKPTSELTPTDLEYILELRDRIAKSDNAIDAMDIIRETNDLYKSKMSTNAQIQKNAKLMSNMEAIKQKIVDKVDDALALNGKYKSLNKEYSRLAELDDRVYPLIRKPSNDEETIGQIKKIFSPARGDVDRTIREFGELVGRDRIQEARIAREYAEKYGDPTATSLLRQMAEISGLGKDIARGDTVGLISKILGKVVDVFVGDSETIIKKMIKKLPGDISFNPKEIKKLSTIIDDAKKAIDNGFVSKQKAQKIVDKKITSAIILKAEGALETNPIRTSTTKKTRTLGPGATQQTKKPGLSSTEGVIDDTLPTTKTNATPTDNMSTTSSRNTDKKVKSDTVKAKASELKEPSKDLQPLYEEARKYKSADEFAEAYQARSIMDLSDREKHKFGRLLEDGVDEDTMKYMDAKYTADIYGSRGNNEYKRQRDTNVPDVKSPDDIVTIYRGTVKSQKAMEPGDFVTFSKDYALSHNEGAKLITLKVPAKDVVRQGADFNEWIYSPEKLRGGNKYQGGLRKIREEANK